VEPQLETTEAPASSIEQLAHHIGGRPFAGRGDETMEAIDPATGTAWARFPVGTAADVDAAVAAARDGLAALARLTPLDRGRALGRLARLIEAHAEELVDLTVTEVGKPVDQAQIDVAKTIDWFDHAAGWPSRMSGSVPAASVPGRWAYTIKEPVGVVAAIVPWNYPLMLASWKVAPALAAGCGVVLKPSELTPKSALRLAELATEAGLPPGALNVVTGDGTTGDGLVRAAVDKVSFTGSAEVGHQVASIAGATGKPVTLELGGKSAAILAPDLARDPELRERAIGAIVEQGVLHNAGQACNASSRLIVPREAADAAAEVAGATLGAAVVGDPRADGTEVGPLASATQRERVDGFVTRARNGDAAIAGCGVIDGPGHYYRPGVVRAPASAEIAREEVFGPVLTLLDYDDLDAAIAAANDSHYGLAAGVFSRDVDLVHRIARGLSAGHVYVNHWSTQDPTVPFGGRRSSGIGVEHGDEGFEAFVVTKSVWLAEAPS
jgi:acyl-CoA reductase-like NAD-dependent aldehyde dehydrogenase